jgi:hypothetical protein
MFFGRSFGSLAADRTARLFLVICLTLMVRRLAVSEDHFIDAAAHLKFDLDGLVIQEIFFGFVA